MLMSPLTLHRLISDDYHDLIKLLWIACQAVLKESFTEQELADAQLKVSKFKEKFVQVFRDVPIDANAPDRMLFRAA